MTLVEAYLSKLVVAMALMGVMGGRGGVRMVFMCNVSCVSTGTCVCVWAGKGGV